ncbi:DUF6415 family natural product biosynthesis protein [Streptomyces sp. QH1-20]|uniref:DUF6415 family natural product biosynthesis protein n=1 Tax=Streptomyces sp. QH1-20 TaxID=3240934 RepID=UPI003512E308
MYDDLEAVLGEHADPSGAEVEELTGRFRENLSQLVAVSRGTAASAAGRAHVLLREAPPPGFGPARTYLRRLALITLAMLDVLDEDEG